MGTMISLSLNDVDIDWGKNRYWKNHNWLFPPKSLTQIKYFYADDVVKTRAGFQTTLEETRFRLCHLGYSRQETQEKFRASVERWNRTSELHLSFADFHSALVSVDFASLTSADMQAYRYDFRLLLLELLDAWDTEDASLEDFILEHLDFTLILRVLADRADNRPLPLRWHYQDLVESGWVSMEDLADIDRDAFVMSHMRLVGRLQDYSGIAEVKSFDNWLSSQGLPKTTPYVKLGRHGELIHNMTTLPTAVRNMIHHPENVHNSLSNEDLSASVELLLETVKGLSGPFFQ